MYSLPLIVAVFYQASGHSSFLTAFFFSPGSLSLQNYVILGNFNIHVDKEFSEYGPWRAEAATAAAAAALVNLEMKYSGSTWKLGVGPDNQCFDWHFM